VGESDERGRSAQLSGEGGGGRQYENLKFITSSSQEKKGIKTPFLMEFDQQHNKKGYYMERKKKPVGA